MRQTWDTSSGTAAGTAVQRGTERPGLALRALRGLSGLLAGGLVALAVTVGVAQWLIGSSEQPGPGMATVVGHAVAALAATALQLVADRSRGSRAALTACSVLMLTAAVLWFGWYA